MAPFAWHQLSPFVLVYMDWRSRALTWIKSRHRNP